jgi:multiple sugar transport system permease protein
MAVIRGRRRRIDIVNVFAYVCLGFWMLFAIFPVAWAYLQSFKMPQEIFVLPPKLIFQPTLHNYLVVFGLQYGNELENVAQTTATTGVTSEFPRYFLNSLIVSTGTTVMALILGASTAYSLARFRYKAKQTILLSILLVRMIPGIVLIIPFYLLYRDLGLIDTHLGLIIAYLSFNLPFTIWMMRGFFLDIPVELEEAAMVDGASRVAALVRIVLPLAAPGMAATAIFALLLSWNEFLFAVLLTSNNAKTLSPSILSYITDKAVLWGRLYAAGCSIILPVLIFSVSVQKYLARGLTGGAVKG